MTPAALRRPSGRRRDEGRPARSSTRLRRVEPGAGMERSGLGRVVASRAANRELNAATRSRLILPLVRRGPQGKSNFLAERGARTPLVPTPSRRPPRAAGVKGSAQQTGATRKLRFSEASMARICEHWTLTPASTAARGDRCFEKVPTVIARSGVTKQSIRRAHRSKSGLLRFARNDGVADQDRQAPHAAVLASVKVQCSQILAMLASPKRSCAWLRVAARFP